MRFDLGKSAEMMQKRWEKYDDKAIAEAWTKMAKDKPIEHLVTSKGLAIEVRRVSSGHSKVQYEAFVPGVNERVAWMYTGGILGGRVQVTNANVYEVDGVDYKRKGIATVLYDLIERDIQAAGGEKIEPQFGSMSNDAIEFWKKRRPEYAAKIEEMNRLGFAANGLFD